MSERDPFAPIIEGFDCSGITDPYSLRCEPFFVDGENGGTLLDGSTVHDVLASKVRLSWALNVMTPAQYAALNAATQGAESLDTVRAYVYDPTVDAVRLAKFHVTRPVCRTIRNMGQIFAIPQSELVLEEASPIARFAVTPPVKTAYDVGDALDLTGAVVTLYDPDGAASDITAECAFDPAAGSVLRTAGAVALTVSYDNAPIAAIPLTVAPSEPVAGDDWWTLYDSGLLDIYRRGDMPDFDNDSSAPWYQYSWRITSVMIGDSVTSIGDDAFVVCTNLTSVAIPDSVTSIGKGAFSSCERLNSLVIGSGVTSIGYNAFARCRALTSVAIPDSVTSIGEGAFHYCARLTSVTIGESVTSIGGEAFSDCTNLTSVAIPDSVTSIGGFAFSDCANLTSVTIGSGVTNIEYGTFIRCRALTSVAIPDSVTSIVAEAFHYCGNLTDVYYGGSQEQWNAIRIGVDNTPLTNATIHYNSAGPDDTEAAP